MRVLLVSTNRERSPFPVAPLGALAVASATRRAGYEVDLLDLGPRRFPRRALRSALRRTRYDVVGFSIRNLDNCCFDHPYSYLADHVGLAREVRRDGRSRLVLGGSGFSISPAGWIRHLEADHGIVGEGEWAFPALLERLASGTSPRDMIGVVSAGDPPPADELRARTCRDALDDMPHPAHEDCRYAWYTKRGGFVPVQTKRGCPCKCVYCVYPDLEGARTRPRDPASVVDEIESVVRNQGQRWFFITDGVFNMPRKHALAVCLEISKRQLDIGWMAYCNPVGLDRELARAMVDSGCVGVEIGLDSAAERMLTVLRKPFDQADIRATLEATADSGLLTAIHLLFGGPTETPADVRETQQFLLSCRPVSAVFASVGIRIHENTPMESLARDEGILLPGYDLFEPTYYVSPGLTTEPLAAVDEVVRERPEWSSPTDWKKLSMRTIQRVINRFGSRPQWRDVCQYGKHMRR